MKMANPTSPCDMCRKRMKAHSRRGPRKNTHRTTDHLVPSRTQNLYIAARLGTSRRPETSETVKATVLRRCTDIIRSFAVRAGANELTEDRQRLVTVHRSLWKRCGVWYGCMPRLGDVYSCQPMSWTFQTSFTGTLTHRRIADRKHGMYRSSQRTLAGRRARRSNCQASCRTPMR